jgi:hypothetical protein
MSEKLLFVRARNQLACLRQNKMWGKKLFINPKQIFMVFFCVLLLPFFLCNSAEEKETILMSRIIEKIRKSFGVVLWNQHENS